MKCAVTLSEEELHSTIVTGVRAAVVSYRQIHFPIAIEICDNYASGSRARRIVYGRPKPTVVALARALKNNRISRAMTKCCFRPNIWIPPRQYLSTFRGLMDLLVLGAVGCSNPDVGEGPTGCGVLCEARNIA